ncbi:hypothetical protein PIB30_010477 [Stylosanthes scabra]|uniref:Uncharacterized protein n=1 Tax=Stylosanthes scabra TaxID=79078 RepID=A0ABU6Z296_9FABA|nr:hypothetical protein [Stylosanthes scabra]
MDEVCKVFGYGRASLPIKYLAIQLGANQRRVQISRPMIEKVEKRLKGRQVKFCNDMGDVRLLLGNEVGVKEMSVWKDIISIGGLDNKVLQQGEQLWVGSGTSVRFWHDTWVKKGVLKLKFLQLFLLANDKNIKIGDYGVWNGLSGAYCGVGL